MISLHRDPWYQFSFEDARIIPRFHLQDQPTGTAVQIRRDHPVDGMSLGEAVVGTDGWVDLPAPILVQAGDTFYVIPLNQ